MARGYGAATWLRAHDLVVEQGLSYAEAAKEAGVDLSSLQKRAAEEKWQDERRAREQRAREYRQTALQLKQKLLQAAVAQDNPDPQVVHAWMTAERAFPEREYGELTGAQKAALVSTFIDGTMEYVGAQLPELQGVLSQHLEPWAAYVQAKSWSAA